MKTLKIYVFVCYCISITSSFAQSPKDIEADLLKSIKKIEPFVPSGISAPAYDIDSLGRDDSLLCAKLELYTAKYPFTISQSFKSFLDAGLGITTSADGLLRIYDWNTGLGGTQQDYMNVIQYKVGEKTKCKVLEEGEDKKKPMYGTIYTLKTINKVYYLATYNAKMDLSDNLGGIQIFSVEDGVLNDDVKLIKTKTGLHNRLEYNYNDTFIYEKGDEWPSIKYDEKSAILKIPVVMENGRGNGKFITYKFTGQYFKKVKN